MAPLNTAGALPGRVALRISGGSGGGVSVLFFYATQSWVKNAPISTASPTVSGFTPAAGGFSAPGRPAGISINANNGDLTGTPTVEAYSQSFVVTVIDNVGGTHTTTVNYTTAVAPVISYVGDPFTWDTGDPVSQAVTNTGGTTGVVYSVQSGALPGGVTVNASTGTLEGTPLADASGSAVILATGPTGLTGTTTVHWTTFTPTPVIELFTSFGYWANEV